MNTVLMLICLYSQKHTFPALALSQAAFFVPRVQDKLPEKLKFGKAKED